MPRGPRRHLAAIVAATAVVVAVATVVPGAPAATNLGCGAGPGAMVMADAPPAATVRIDPSASLRGYATPAVDARQGRDAQRRQLRQRPALRHVRRPRRQRQRRCSPPSSTRAAPPPSTASACWRPAPTLPLHLPRRDHARHLDDLGSGGGVQPAPLSFDQPLMRPRTLRTAKMQDPDQAGGVRVLPDRAADDDVDLRRHLPGSDDRAAGRQGHQGHLRQPAAGAAPASPCTCTATTTGWRTTGSRRGTSSRTGKARTYDYPLADGGRPERGRVLLVPRPPDDGDDPQQLARPAGHVPRHRRQERRSWACPPVATTCR